MAGDVKKLIDPKYIRKTLNIPIIQFVNEELFRKNINDSLQSIVDFINQQRILQLGEIGWYLEKPENGTVVFASGWTELVSPTNGLTRNSGFNPKFPSTHTVTTGTLYDGRGLWIWMVEPGLESGYWYQITLGPKMPVQ